MSVREAFFDTNILLYLLSADDVKADAAEEVVANKGTISVQVLNEFVSVARRKLSMPWEDIRDILSQIRELCVVVPLMIDGHERAMALSEKYGFTIYDATIIASALIAGCSILYTEDLQDGQKIDGLTIHNPFRLMV